MHLATEADPETDDTTPPATVEDLAIVPGWDLPTGMRCLCTASGDDGMSGTANQVCLRAATSDITNEAEWDAATPLHYAGSSEPWHPNVIAGGDTKNFEVTENPFPGVPKYVAVRFRDEAGNTGGISNRILWDEVEDS